MQRLFDEIRPEDLLRRTRVQTNLKAVLTRLSGKRIWVTGAAGSIGSELVRQLVHLQPESLTLVDFNENGLYLIAREIEQIQQRNEPLRGVEVRQRFLDLKQSARIEAALRQDKPEYIFHAAAHKHVGMMESHPHAALENNVQALRRLLESAAAAGVRRFVNISTDKACDPVSVMGATKRLGELLCALGDHGPLETVSVRFGNVLGSQGSVIPLFLQQIDRGGPVTITDKRATRFFMTISEAVELILQASVIGKSRRIYLLNMGSSVNLYELAKELISLRGFIPEVEVPISEIGLRKGERLHELLHNEKEKLVSTDCESVLELSAALPERARFVSELDEFLERNGDCPPEKLREDLIRWIGELEAARKGVPEAVAT
jgi:FlaA1/EpsC-like NDP-sugar epimerase